MRFYSTRQPSRLISLSEAVLGGLAPDGGLYMPEKIPVLPPDFWQRIHGRSFQEISLEIARTLIQDDLPETILQEIVYDAVNFPAPLVLLENGISVLELFHGPTMAFKDFGARFMARMMAWLVRDWERELTILVATSGDTGSAVGNAFHNVHGIRVVILYPGGKVSYLQEQQITTIGENVTALEISGSFDDCQHLVKTAFLDPELLKKLALSSANSINIARLIPQIFYYVQAYAQLYPTDTAVIFTVPSGNLGNLTAGLIAKRMGLPVQRFVAATNVNDVVPQYLKTGQFLPQPMKMTLSNAMDVGNPSNFQRILDLYGHDYHRICADIWGDYVTDEQTRLIMKEVFAKTGYILDPHGAVGYLGLKKYFSQTGMNIPGIFLETAHPAKFADVVEPIINQKVVIPAQLKHALTREKQAIQLPNQFSVLKEYLLSYELFNSGQP